MSEQTHGRDDIVHFFALGYVADFWLVHEPKRSDIETGIAFRNNSCVFSDECRGRLSVACFANGLISFNFVGTPGLGPLVIPESRLGTRTTFPANDRDLKAVRDAEQKSIELMYKRVQVINIHKFCLLSALPIYDGMATNRFTPSYINDVLKGHSHNDLANQRTSPHDKKLRPISV